jgi:hypothetical protein
MHFLNFAGGPFWVGVAVRTIKALTAHTVAFTFHRLAMTRFGIENNHVRPELTDRVSIIEIEGGRHPLQEMLTASFIANDTALIPDKTRMFVAFGIFSSIRRVLLRCGGKL